MAAGRVGTPSTTSSPRTSPAALPADAISYPLRIVGDARSATVEFEDAPAFFGHELRILGSVTFDSNHKIIRWIDYWDGRHFGAKLTAKIRTPAD